MENNISLREKIEKIFFDYHIRGCKLCDKETNDLCNSRKKYSIEELISAFREEMPEKKEVIFTSYDAIDNDPSNASKYYTAEGWNDYHDALQDKLK